MPKDRSYNSSSFDRPMMSPKACSLTNSNRHNCATSSPPSGHEAEWEEARCPICIEHPHNAVLLLCSSQDKGCRPFMCDTSYHHSNCLDQYCKSSTHEPQSDLTCPLCRGRVNGWVVIDPARRYMNSKPRSCSLETCGFSGTYKELRKHARLDHPLDRPTEASPARLLHWATMEQHRDIEDAFAHRGDMEYDMDRWPGFGILDEWPGLDEDDVWSDGTFFNFQIGMSDFEDDLMDGMTSPSVFSLPNIISFFSDEEIMSYGASRSMFRSENGPTISMSISGYEREHNGTNLGSRSNYASSRSSHHRTRSNYYRGNAHTSSRTRSSYHGGSGSRSSYRRGE